MDVLTYLAIVSLVVSVVILFIDPHSVDKLPLEIRTVAIVTVAFCAAIFCSCLALILVVQARVIW